MMIWISEAAERSILSAVAHIAIDSPSAASSVLDRIHSAIDLISKHPYIGRTGQNDWTRELPVRRTRYVVVYRIAADAVEILDIYHTSRDRPFTDDPR